MLTACQVNLRVSGVKDAAASATARRRACDSHAWALQNIQSTAVISSMMPNLVHGGGMLTACQVTLRISGVTDAAASATARRRACDSHAWALQNIQSTAVISSMMPKLVHGGGMLTACQVNLQISGVTDAAASATTRC